MFCGFFLPVLFGLLAFRLVRRIAPDLNAREAILYAAALTGLFIVATTEALSAFRAITASGIALAWAAGCLALFLFHRRLARSASPASRTRYFPLEDGLSPVLLALVLVIVGLSALIAFFGVPNTYDAMTYHLARVAHWLQNRSVAIFATGCLYQNQHSPWAEWTILHLVLLQGNERAANFVQWASFIGCLVAVSLLAEKCGGSKRAGILAAFLAATLPMAILQASSTQNDLALAFWLLTFAYGGLKVAENPAWPHLVFCGVTLGLAMLTKALAYLIAPAFCLGLSLFLLRRGLRFALPRLVLVALIAHSLNAGHYLRNWTSSGTLLGADRDSGPGYSYQNETHTPGALFSNVIRNLALQMPQLPAVIAATQQAVGKIDAALGLDPSDPRLTTYTPRFFVPPYQDETECANPVHLLAIALSFGLLIALRSRFSGNLQFLAVSVVAGALIFCFVLKWQPFHSRLHLPLLLLAVPVVAVVFDTLRFRLLTLLFVALMLASACNPLLYGRNHPLLGEYSIFAMSPAQQRYFIRSDIRDEYENALRLFREKNVRSIGVVSPPDNSGWEYPLFDPDLFNDGSFPWRVEQVRVQNCYAPLETNIIPDAVVVLWPDQEKVILVHGNDYYLALPGKYGISVYLK